MWKKLEIYLLMQNASVGYLLRICNIFNKYILKPSIKIFMQSIIQNNKPYVFTDKTRYGCVHLSGHFYLLKGKQ